MSPLGGFGCFAMSALPCVDIMAAHAGRYGRECQVRENAFGDKDGRACVTSLRFACRRSPPRSELQVVVASELHY